jgi:hypothetical protein
MCRHLVAVAIKDNIKIDGLNKTKSKFYMIIRKRVRVVVHSDDENEEGNEEGSGTEHQHEAGTQIEETYTTQIPASRPPLASHALITDEISSVKKRGRKPKNAQTHIENASAASRVIPSSQYGIMTRRQTQNNNK